MTAQNPAAVQHRAEQGRTGGGSLVVGLDGLEHDADALALARTLQAALGGEIVLAHVSRPVPLGPGMSEQQKVEQREGRELLARAAEFLGAPADVRLVEPRPAADGLTETAIAVDANLLVLGSSHRGGIGQVVPGGVASLLLTRAPCAIAVAPVGYARSRAVEIASVAVAYDATRESDVALSAAAAAAVRLGAPLRLYHAMHAVSPAPEWAEFRQSMHGFAQGIIDHGHEQLPSGLVTTTRVLEGDSAQVLAEAAAEDGAGLLFVGSRGYGPLREALLGGVAGGLLRTATCPLVIVPRRARPPLTANGA